MYKISRQEVKIDKLRRVYTFNCPHCKGIVEVKEDQVNCQIFRHGIIKSTGMQVNPHSPKTYCDNLVEKKLVYGCCRPFKMFIHNTLEPYVEVCDYI